MDDTEQGTDPKYNYDFEPSRIQKGSPAVRGLLKKLGLMSARERRIENNKD